MSMPWTRPADIRAQVLKLWARGSLLAEYVQDTGLFPLRLHCKGPKSREAGEHFEEVRSWAAALCRAARAGDFRLEMRCVHDRVLGSNELPCAVWLDSLEDAVRLAGKRQEAQQFRDLLALTKRRRPVLLPWLARRPLQALGLAAHWHLLLDITDWMEQHRRPGIFVRQMDVPGVHTKFVEAHKGVLAELFDLVLPPEDIDETARGSAGFTRRYGFADKPVRVRFRLTDPGLAPVFCGAADITIPQEDFARVQLPLQRVFITENEINFLAFPACTGSMVIFGAGYGFEHLADVPWLKELPVWYWGDLDTHGFAILNQLRTVLPQTASLLMDEETLLAHKDLWVREPEQKKAELAHLTSAEARVYAGLCANTWGEQVRLEQERISWAFLCRALARLEAVPQHAESSW